ncbi:hypothetical protein [Streptomyces ipomoeae]|uniref:hypothetical protein n=1 Tax=Streptomyces ipomoeae TaxID=103232 RepID=UPI00114775BB|nr:hypothetical protein [Streptomyces ipomoeae]MDX2937658.1 hypothetical protein [Streptomyces ipomoeae]TQE22784.1 hypothetical protein SipoB123_21635 [Streptomyces ipomoeae]
MTDRIEPTARELRQLLAVVLEALDIPSPATVDDSEQYHQVLNDRASHARIALVGVLLGGDDPGWSADYLRTRLADHPATGYRTWDDTERARRSIDEQFPAVARFLADERDRA